MPINEAKGPIRQPRWFTEKGPWVTGQRTLPEHEQMFLHYSCKVARGTSIDAEDIPFGYFVSIELGNHAESILNVFEVPPTAGEHVFAIRTSQIKRFNDFICLATVKKQVVPIDTAPDVDDGGSPTPTPVWESRVEPIDDKHALKTTVYATATVDVNRNEWDDQLNQYVQITESLVNAYAASSVTTATIGSGPGAYVQVTHTHYTSVKCNWWKKTVEVFRAVSRTYSTTVDFYWPAVLTSFNHIALSRKDLPNGDPGGSNFYSFPVFSKEAYRGPCAAEVTEVWSLAVQTPPDIQAMQPLPVTITTPWVGVNVGPSLHAEFTYTITIADDPEFESADIEFGFGATNPANWPSSVVGSFEQSPTRGGYLSRKIVVFAPSY